MPLERVGGAELTERWPAWRVEGSATAIFQPDAGIVAASRANAAHRRLATERGAELVDRTEVVSIAPDGDGFAIETSAGRYLTFEPDAEYAAAVDGFLAQHLPGAVGPKIALKTCQYALTPASHFVLDQIPGLRRSAVGLGTGHAFKFASAFGRALVDLAVDGRSEWRLARFALDRFSGR